MGGVFVRIHHVVAVVIEVAAAAIRHSVDVVVGIGKEGEQRPRSTQDCLL